MSDLNLSINSEEQDAIETKIANIMGGGIINSYASVASEVVSQILVAQAKPANFEELLATQEVYSNVMKKLFGVDEVTFAAEKIKAYHRLSGMIAQYEEQIAAQQAQQEAMMPMGNPDIVDARSTEVASGVDKIAEATENAKEAMEKATELVGESDHPTNPEDTENATVDSYEVAN